MSPPHTPAGKLATMLVCVELTTAIETPPMVTVGADAPPKLLPLIVMFVPELPFIGDTEAIIGAA